MFKKLDHSSYEFLQDNATIFDIGSKDNVGGEYAFGKPPTNARVKFVLTSKPDTPGVDLVADAHDLSMAADGSVDCVVTVSTLRHIRFPQKVMVENRSILHPGKILYVGGLFMFPFNKDQEGYYRFSIDGIKVLCEDFECIESGFNRVLASCMCHLLVHFCAITLSFNNKIIYGINVDLFTWLLFWIKYLDIILGKYKMAKVIHAGVYFLGRKTHAPDVLLNDQNQ